MTGHITTMLTFLCTAEECAIILKREVDLNEVRAGEQLHDHARGDDGCDTEFHEGSAVRGEDDTHPVERVGRVRGHDTVQRHLRAYQEDEERHRRPEHLLVEGDL